MKAAIALFDEQGYEATTVAQIAERAGLTKRTYFRYFSDKREVLFSGSDTLQQVWSAAIAAAPPEVSPLTAAAAGLDPVADMFVERHSFAQVRSRIIEANSELRERELIKLQYLSASIEEALVSRQCPADIAILAAQAVVTVFRVAFGRWVQQDDPDALRRLMDDALQQLRVVSAG